MKQKSIYGALMALMVMGVVFASCTNADNPYNTTAPDGKYVMTKDSTVYSNGDSRLVTWEFDAEGKMVKESADYHYPDGSYLQIINTFTYSENLITRQTVTSKDENSLSYFYLNSKGLIERFIDEEGLETRYEYDDNDRIVMTSEDGKRDLVAWENDDVVRFEVNTYGDGSVINYTSSDQEVYFPYLISYLLNLDTAMTPIGLFGKATRHLVSTMHLEKESGGNSVYLHDDFSYVVRNGLVMEFIANTDQRYTIDGESTDKSLAEHHYLYWEKR